MVNRILKAFIATVLLFTSWLGFLFVGILFRLIGESLGYSNNTMLGLLFLTSFSVAYVCIGRYNNE